jgi:protein translocase SecG subunit
MELFSTVLRVVLVIVAFSMTALIMVQGGKGDGMAAFGGTRAEETVGLVNPLRFWTGILAALFFVLVIVLALAGKA